MIKILLTIWIIIKHRIGVARGWIGNVNNEIRYVKRYIKDATFEGIKEKGMEYRNDKLDEQMDARVAFRKGYDDYDGFNRISQVWYHNKGYKSFLISYWAKPFKMSHTTNIIRKDGLWFGCDYGTKSENGFYDFEVCLNEIAKKYKAEIKAYVVQDIQWRVVKI